MDDFLEIVVAPLVVIMVFVGGITFGAIKWQHSMDQTACTVFADQSGRETKFVDYNWASWDCLTPQSDGKWISTSNLRDI